MIKKRDLAAAKLDKKDEFYTQLTDIEKRCAITASILEGKLSYATVMTHLKVTFSNISP